MVGRYITGRLIQLVFVLIGVSIVVFVTMHLLPGDVAQLLLGEHATNEQLQRLRQQLGLDEGHARESLQIHRGKYRSPRGRTAPAKRSARPEKAGNRE